MYNLPYFKAHSPEQVLAFMKAHPFVTLCGVDAEGQVAATHVPVLFAEREGKLFLQAHIMRQTDHHKAFLQQPQVLVIFNGAHAYVSASWYANARVASTWNYQSVQARGILRFEQDGSNALLMNVLQQLTAQFEGDAHSPSLMEHLPEAYVAQHMKAIVAFEIEVTDIQHVFKLSQNHDAENRRSIIAHLAANAQTAAMAATMTAYYAEVISGDGNDSLTPPQ